MKLKEFEDAKMLLREIGRTRLAILVAALIMKVWHWHHQASSE
jgi:hypothetical protein